MGPVGQSWTVTGVFGGCIADDIGVPLAALGWRLRSGMAPDVSTGTLVPGGMAARIRVAA